MFNASIVTVSRLALEQLVFDIISTVYPLPIEVVNVPTRVAAVKRVGIFTYSALACAISSTGPASAEKRNFDSTQRTNDIHFFMPILHYSFLHNSARSRRISSTTFSPCPFVMYCNVKTYSKRLIQAFRVLSRIVVIDINVNNAHRSANAPPTSAGRRATLAVDQRGLKARC